MPTPTRWNAAGWFLGLSLGCLATGAGAATPAAGPPGAGQDVAADEQLFADARLPHTDAALLDFLRKRLVSPATRQRVEALIPRLAGESFQERQQAAADLIAEGPPALSMLRLARRSGGLELQNRCAHCIAEIEKRSPNTLVLAAARLLKARRTPGALAVLLEYAALAPEDDVEWEVFGSIYHLGLTNGTPNPLLADALRGREPARRAVAALVVGQFGTAAQRQTVRGLLAEAEPKVRFRAAQGLLLARDPAGIPALIDLLPGAPWELAVEAADLLDTVAGEKRPAQLLDKQPAARRQCHAAWRAWWDANQTQLDLAGRKLEAPFGDAAQRASTGAVQFLRAFLAWDAAQVARTTEVPFSIYAQLNYATREQLDAYINARKEDALDLSDHRITVRRVLSAAEYLKGARDGERKFLEAVRPAHIRVVCVDLSGSPVEGEVQETHAVFIRISGGRPRCVGIGRPPQVR
jgi:hypothetical protein